MRLKPLQIGTWKLSKTFFFFCHQQTILSLTHNQDKLHQCSTPFTQTCLPLNWTSYDWGISFNNYATDLFFKIQKLLAGTVQQIWLLPISLRATVSNCCTNGSVWTVLHQSHTKHCGVPPHVVRENPWTGHIINCKVKKKWIL